MTLIALPASPAPQLEEWTFRQPSQANRSEFTGRRRVTILGEAPRWSTKVTLPAIRGEKAVRPWRRFLLKLQGRVNSFRLVAVEGRQFNAPGIVSVDGAGQTGFTLATRGWTPGTYIENIFITVADQLLQVDGRVIAGVDGKAVLPVLPHLRLPSIDGVPVEVQLPFAVVSLSDDQVRWSTKPGPEYAIELEVEEAF